MPMIYSVTFAVSKLAHTRVDTLMTVRHTAVGSADVRAVTLPYFVSFG